MSTYKLMQDPKAAEIYCSLGMHIHPATLADDYQAARLAGDDSLCLALETYIRDTARVHFHRPEVLEALNSMERAKARRKMGKGAPRMLQDIAHNIRIQYKQGAGVRLGDGRLKFRVGRLSVTCKDSPGAVELVACKYERGLPGGFGNGRAAR